MSSTKVIEGLAAKFDHNQSDLMKYADDLEAIAYQAHQIHQTSQ